MPARRSRAFAAALLCCAFSAAASPYALANPYARGPAPTAALLEADLGPFSYRRTEVAGTAASGYGGGTIYHPANVAGPFAGIAIAPGYLSTRSTMSWWGERLASHGFVVVTIDTHSIYDQPAERTPQLMAALRQLVTFGKSPSHPLYRKLDPNRLGVMGHSMGGGATLLAASENPTLTAAIALAPWNFGGDFAKLRVPTLVVACEGDPFAAVAAHASPFYGSIPDTTSKAYMSFKTEDHFCVMSGNSFTRIMGKYGVAWMKRFMDKDTRYSQFLCGTPHQEDLSEPQLSQYRENCPY